MTVDASGNPVIENVMTTNEAEVMIGDPKNGDARLREVLCKGKACPVMDAERPIFLIEFQMEKRNT